MIVSHRHKFIFIKTGKTAGTSMEIALSQICGEDDIITPISPRDENSRRELGFRGPQNTIVNGETLVNHDRPPRIRAVLGDDVWSRYFKFTIERNPFDRAISLYWQLIRRERPPGPIGEILATTPERRLSNWTFYAVNDRIVVDHIMRYESLPDELRALEVRFGFGPLNMIRAKGGHRQDRRPYREVLGPAERALIERVCARELAHFGYRW